jgi:3-oxoacyl-[acyl-carrier-protein] synthase-3
VDDAAMTGGVAMAGFGHYLPERRVENAEIEAELHLAPGWIAARTGIHARHYAAPDQAVSDLAVPAGQMALRQAGLAADRVGLLLLATSTPDHLLPPTAPLVAHRLGLNCGAMDLAGACAGFLQALVLAAGHVRMSGQAVLVIAANILSRRIAPGDIATRALFADAAGAVLLAPCADHRRGPQASVLRSNGAGYGLIQLPRGGSRLPFDAPGKGGLRMAMRDGRKVFAAAVEGMTRSASQALAEAGIAAADLMAWLPHQANARIIDKVGANLGLGGVEWLGALAQYGNSSAATMPLALSLRMGREPALPSGPVLLSAFGAGTIWGAAVWQHRP